MLLILQGAVSFPLLCVLLILMLRFPPTFLISLHFPHIIYTCMSYSVILAVHLRCNSSHLNYQVVIPMD
ncbi:hypothetical protein BD769DRAFT_63394 [Suillus cothurnatus]|nr:hypothetical protein BD769DRAFT_63394 [Suillus cothurnatus]